MGVHFITFKNLILLKSHFVTISRPFFNIFGQRKALYMEDFVLYFKMGLNHVLDFSAYDHILFLVVLAVIFSFADWKKVILLASLFTLGHTLTLALAAYKIVNINVAIIEFLIPVTIFITGAVNIINTQKEGESKGNVNLIFALFFGLIHGLGFSNYFRMMVGQEEDKLMPLIEFALGIEMAQVIIVLAILTLSYLAIQVAKLKANYWILFCSGMVLIIAAKMMYERIFW